MTAYERCANCKKSKWSHAPGGFWEKMIHNIPLRISIICPDAVDGIVIPSEYDQICNLGCKSFEDNAPKR